MFFYRISDPLQLYNGTLCFELTAGEFFSASRRYSNRLSTQSFIHGRLVMILELPNHSLPSRATSIEIHAKKQFKNTNLTFKLLVRHDSVEL